jgi:ABC-type sugar transport system ATPase subunit
MPGQLSGGQRQRVALGRALLRDPVAFLLDEPLSNLDAKLRAGMRTELIKLHRRVGRTIVHVTHDQVEAMTMAERICIMKDGRIVQVGPPMEVYRNPADTFVAGFLASPPMNLIQARVMAESDAVSVQVHGRRIALPPSAEGRLSSRVGQAVVLGLRPEGASLEAGQGGAVPLDIVALAVEVLGPEVILVSTIGDPEGPEVSLRMPPEFTAGVGQPIRVWIDPASIRLFDPATTRAIPLA